MMQVITCTQCHKSGALPVRLAFTYDVSSCGVCYQRNDREWKYYFCDAPCLADWWNQNHVDEQGFPCLNCIGKDGQPSGFKHGFEVNGECDTCKGILRVRGY